MNLNMYRLRFEAYRIRKLPIPILVYKAVLKLAGLLLGAALMPVTALPHFLGVSYSKLHFVLESAKLQK